MTARIHLIDVVPLCGSVESQCGNRLRGLLAHVLANFAFATSLPKWRK